MTKRKETSSQANSKPVGGCLHAGFTVENPGLGQLKAGFELADHVVLLSLIPTTKLYHHSGRRYFDLLFCRCGSDIPLQGRSMANDIRVRQCNRLTRSSEYRLSSPCV